MSQLGLELGHTAEDFGEKGRQCWLWQNGRWQSGRAWSIDNEGTVNGRARDYGEWGVPYPGVMPCETHGRWPWSEVSFKKPADQYVLEPRR